MMPPQADICANLAALQDEILQLPDRVTPTSFIPEPKIVSPPEPSVHPGSIPKWSAPTRFAKLRLSIRRLSTKSPVSNSPDRPERPLLSSTGSASTLSSPSSVRSEVVKDDATILLSLLAPLISRLQKLGQAIRAVPTGSSQEISISFEQCCQGLERKIRGYSHSDPDLRGDTDPHDLEMKTLLLDALSKKVQQERNTTISSQISPPPASSPSAHDHDQAREIPLILHSSGVLSEHRRSITPPTQPNRAIPIGINVGGQLGVYPSFTNASQQIGLSNVFRLGSYQNSLLFSPSPVAVRQPATAEPLRV